MFESGWGLATTMLLPMLGALFVGFVQPKSEDLIKGVAFITTLGTLLLSVVAARRVSPAPGEEIILDVYLGAIPGFADRYYITDFGIRLPLVVFLGFVAIIVIIYSWKQWEKPSQAKALVMVSLVVLDILMLELVLEEGSPLPLAVSGLLLADNLRRALPKAGQDGPAATDASRLRTTVSRPTDNRPMTNLSRRPRRHSKVSEEDMSGLVR